MGCASSKTINTSNNLTIVFSERNEKTRSDASVNNGTSAISSPSTAPSDVILRGDHVQRGEARLQRNLDLEIRQRKAATRAETLSQCALYDTERLTVSSMKSHVNSFCGDGEMLVAFQSHGTKNENECLSNSCGDDVAAPAHGSRVALKENVERKVRFHNSFSNSGVTAH